MAENNGSPVNILYTLPQT